MKKTTLAHVRDRKKLKLNNRNDAPFYEMVTKKKGEATITAIKSGRTYVKPLKTKCFVPKEG